MVAFALVIHLWFEFDLAPMPAAGVLKTAARLRFAPPTLGLKPPNNKQQQRLQKPFHIGKVRMVGLFTFRCGGDAMTSSYLLSAPHECRFSYKILILFKLSHPAGLLIKTNDMRLLKRNIAENTPQAVGVKLTLERHLFPQRVPAFGMVNRRFDASDIYKGDHSFCLL